MEFINFKSIYQIVGRQQLQNAPTAQQPPTAPQPPTASLFQNQMMIINNAVLYLMLAGIVILIIYTVAFF